MFTEKLTRLTGLFSHSPSGRRLQRHSIAIPRLAGGRENPRFTSNLACLTCSFFTLTIRSKASKTRHCDPKTAGWKCKLPVYQKLGTSHSLFFILRQVEDIKDFEDTTSRSQDCWVEEQIPGLRKPWHASQAPFHPLHQVETSRVSKRDP